MIYDLRKKAEEELLNNLGPFWLKLIDNENGGFYGEVTYDLKNIMVLLSGLLCNKK